MVQLGLAIELPADNKRSGSLGRSTPHRSFRVNTVFEIMRFRGPLKCNVANLGLPLPLLRRITACFTNMEKDSVGLRARFGVNLAPKSRIEARVSVGQKRHQTDLGEML